MLIIDSSDTISLVFSGDYSEFNTGLTLLIRNTSTNKSSTKSFVSLLLSNDRYTEMEIDWADTLENGEYRYTLLNDTTELEEGILRVVGVETSLPYYKDNMDEYLSYKNK